MTVSNILDEVIPQLHVNFEKEHLLKCFNLVESELASTYFETITEEFFDNVSKVNFSDFKEKPSRILEANCHYFIEPTRIVAKGNNNITYIKYAFIPRWKKLSDQTHFDSNFKDCYVNGTIAEFMVSQGFYEEADLFARKYKKAISEVSNKI